MGYNSYTMKSDFESIQSSVFFSIFQSCATINSINFILNHHKRNPISVNGGALSSFVYLFFIFHFFLSIVDLRYCDNFCCTAEWPSHIYTHTFPFLYYPHYGLSWEIVYSSLCCIVGPHCLFMLKVSFHLPTPNSQATPLPPSPILGNHMSVLCVCDSLFPLFHHHY